MEVTAEGVLSQQTGPYNEQDLQVLEQNDQQQEELIGGKFKSADDLLQAYQQLERKLGSQNQVEDSVDDDASSEEEEQPEETPVLSQEQEVTIVESIGGTEQFTAVQDWAKENLDPEELEAYNREVNSGDYYRARNALQSLHYAYQDNTGSEPELLGGKLSANSNDVFRSTAEVMDAMSDPRYLKDSAYTNDVQEKLVRSDVLGPRG
jgi:hypothetical protein